MHSGICLRAAASSDGPSAKKTGRYPAAFRALNNSPRKPESSSNTKIVRSTLLAEVCRFIALIDEPGWTVLRSVLLLLEAPWNSEQSPVMLAYREAID